MLALLVPCRGSLMVKALIYHPGDRWFNFFMIFEVYSRPEPGRSLAGISRNSNVAVLWYYLKTLMLILVAFE